MTLPAEAPIKVLRHIAAHLGNVAIGGADAGDLTHTADLIIYRRCVAVVITRWMLPRSDDGLVLIQAEGPLRVRIGRFPPWQNTVVWVRDDRRLAMLLLTPWQRRSLTAALSRSGFGIKQDRASLIYGLRRYES